MNKITDKFVGDVHSIIACSSLGELPINKYVIYDAIPGGWEFIKSKDGNYYSATEVRDYIDKLTKESKVKLAQFMDRVDLPFTPFMDSPTCIEAITRKVVDHFYWTIKDKLGQSIGQKLFDKYITDDKTREDNLDIKSILINIRYPDVFDDLIEITDK